MKEKLKLFYALMRPHLALVLTVALVLGMLPAGNMITAKAMPQDVQGGRKSWRTHPEVVEAMTKFDWENEWEQWFVTAADVGIESYRDPWMTHSVDLTADVAGTSENPYLIRDAVDLILFGMIPYEDTENKAFILTGKEYDMLGNEYYMEPLFPVAAGSDTIESGLYMITPGAFHGDLYGQGAVVKNAYITSNGSMGQRYENGLFSGITKGARVYDITVKNTIFNGSDADHAGGFCGQLDESPDCNGTVDSTTCYSEIIYGGMVVKFPYGLKVIEYEGTGSDRSCIALKNAESAGRLIELDGMEVLLGGYMVLQVEADGFYSFWEVEEGQGKGAKVNGYPVAELHDYVNVRINWNYTAMEDGIYPVLAGANLLHSLDELGINPERKGYYLKGWSTSAAGTNAQREYCPEKSGELYAVWVEKDLSEDALVISQIEDSFIYNGTCQTPSFTVNFGDEQLVEGIDFTITYKDSSTGLSVSDPIAAGKYKVILAGKGEYSGETSFSFEIKPAKVTVKPRTDQKKIYGEPDPKLNYEAEGLISGEFLSGKLSRKTGEAIGMYEITIGDLKEKNPNYDITLIGGVDFMIEPDLSVINSLSEQTVSAADQAEIARLLEMLSGVDQNVRKEKGWEDAYQKCKALLAVIEGAEDAGASESISKTASVTAETVTAGQKTDLEQARADLQTALDTYGKNMTADKKQKLQTELARVEGALTAIVNAENAAALITALPEQADPSNQDAAAQIDAAKKAYDELTENEKKMITPESVTKLNALVQQIQQGADGGTGDSLPAEGTTFTDSKNKAVYKITKSGTSGGTVQYVKPKNKKAKTVSIPATVTDEHGIRYKVTSIAKNAFKNNSYITKLTVGSNVKTIGSSAFYNCKKLSGVTIGKNVTTINSKAFYKCVKLTKITIPSKVSKIGKQAFYGCKKLKTIYIKTSKLSKKKVGSSAFKNIYSKATITVPKKKLKTYKAMLKARGVSSKAKIKK